MPKLTLSVEQSVVSKAKKIAVANNTSVSAMFSRFVQAIGDGRRNAVRIGPLTQKASGVISPQAGRKYKDMLADALMDKYGMKK